MSLVTFDAGPYIALIGNDLIDGVGPQIAKTLAKLEGANCALISDSTVAPIFGEQIETSLTSAGFEPTPITIPAGEQTKTLEQVGKICDQMIAAGLDRKSFVIGLGGGVIGDISGFVAAIFQRGIPHIQIPTTLLAMVDSSIGGKTGVNTAAGKNLLGAVHQPLLVIDDVDVLKTLPPREFKQGFAEIIKHAIIAEAKMFHELSELSTPELEPDRLVGLIRRNVEIKASHVAKDEHDRTGERALLNFGHTIGHGIERAGGYRDFLHGEAISLGMVAAAAISMKRAGLTATGRDAIVALLNKFELPTRLPAGFSRDQILDALKFDKKFERGEIRFVVTPKIGCAQVSRDVTMNDIREAVEAL